MFLSNKLIQYSETWDSELYKWYHRREVQLISWDLFISFPLATQKTKQSFMLLDLDEESELVSIAERGSHKLWLNIMQKACCFHTNCCLLQPILLFSTGLPGYGEEKLTQTEDKGVF